MKNKTTVDERILIFLFAMFIHSFVFLILFQLFAMIPNVTKFVSTMTALVIIVCFAKSTYDIWNCEYKNTENENRIIELEKKIEELTNNK